MSTATNIPVTAPHPTPQAPAQNTPNSTASMIAMINALLAMETILSNVLGKKSEDSLNVQKANTEAVKTAGDKVMQQVKEAEEAASHSSFWGVFGEIFGWIAAALTSILSFGTLSVVAAIAVSAATVAMQSGAFNSGPLADLLDKIAGGQEWAKDLVACGMVAAVSLGAGLTSEALAAGVNAAKTAVGEAAEVGAEAGADSMSGQFSTVSKLTLAQAIITFGPQVIEDMLTAMHIPKEYAQGIAIAICVLLAVKAMKSAFLSEGFDVAEPKGGVSGATLSKIRTGALYGEIVANLATTGFKMAQGVYALKQGQIMEDEAGPKAFQEFMKDFSDIFNDQMSQSSKDSTQMMDNFRTINANFAQLTVALQAAARVTGSN